MELTDALATALGNPELTEDAPEAKTWRFVPLDHGPMWAGMIQAFQQFADALGPAIEQVRTLATRFSYAVHYSRLDLQPSVRYRLAGSPYGNNMHGKKRWLREMKAVGRSITTPTQT